MAVRISRALIEELLAQAGASPDREICGLLFGVSFLEIADARQSANVAGDPRTMFEIDPAMLIAAHKAERSGGPRLLGCYHSHPNGAPELSQTDRDAAGSAVALWLVIASGAIRAWRNTGSGRFHEIEIEILD